MWGWGCCFEESYRDAVPSHDLQKHVDCAAYNNNSKQKQWHFGYKLHLAVDAETELPISCYATPANAADSRNLLPLLEAGVDRFSCLSPETVIADKGYDSQANNRAVIEDFQAAPIIAMRAMRKGAKNRRPDSEHRLIGVIPRSSMEWKNLYAMRTSVERAFGRLKEHRRLKRHCYRRTSQDHCTLPAIGADDAS